MKLTLQQAIFTISNLSKKQRRLLDLIRDSYVVPLKVNGKEVFEQAQADEMLKNLSELDLINQDIVTLKDGINVANTENFIENKSLFALLEEVRLKRNILFDLEYLLKRDTTTVENGVYFLYNTNGTYRTKGAYIMGRPVGLWEYYDKDGKLKDKVIVN